MSSRTPRRSQTDHLEQLPLDALLERGAASIAAALAEDLGHGDPTSESLFDETSRMSARLLAKAPGVVAGLPVARRVFESVDSTVQFTPWVDEGEWVEAGDVLAGVVGSARSILAAERTALNFLQRLSGIATTTARFAQEIATTSARLLDTRKTAPGLRALDKYAVRLGGGRNHRLSLSELAMIKDTHRSAGSLAEAIERIRARHPEVPVEAEVRSLEELETLLRDTAHPPDRILLDNLSIDELSEGVRRVAGRAHTEASGGITRESIGRVARTGVDSISVGGLTHSVQALDISMEAEWGEDAVPITERIRGLREELGQRVLHLAHHYTRDRIVEHADLVGDSLALARAAARADAEFILFSGVRFMGETAAILCREDQRVLMPVPEAGCFLANCADLSTIEQAWEQLTHVVGSDACIPITYVNSSTQLKAFCGQHDGIVCTSSNAPQVLDWALQQRRRVFFFPDRHLAWNTARRQGIDADQIYVWPADGSPVTEALHRARVIAWFGACNVHRRFRMEHVHRVRQLAPDAMVIVHPECAEDVVALADASGSTAQLIRIVEDAPLGGTIAVGTEARLVRRLQRQHPGKRVINLADVAPYCRTMTQTTPRALLETLEDIDAGNLSRREIVVDQETARGARIALERMLQL